MHAASARMRKSISKRLALGVWGVLVGFSALGVGAPRAHAQDAEPHLMSEPTWYTDVADAFDGEDPFDMNVDVAFVHRQQSSTIEREVSHGVSRFADVAKSSSTLNALTLGVEIGLHHDLMLFGRLPLVLSDNRELTLPEKAACNTSDCRARRTTIHSLLSPSGSNAPLIEIDRGRAAASKTRSGVPYLDLGTAYGVTNQYRSPHLPTWVLRAELRVSVGEDMAPCLDGQECSPGLARGTTRFLVGSRWSYRFRYLEPFLGLSYALEWATSAQDRFEPDVSGARYDDASPPSVAETTLGVSIIPWESRGRFQRFAIDTRFDVAYVSAGLDYTPLFDALGSSNNAFLHTPSFSGLTYVGGYAQTRFEAALAMQAARFVRFRLGLGLSTQSAHLLTDAARCTQARTSGASACGDYATNAGYRSVIDAPGQRFRLSSDFAYDLFAMATGQF